MHKEPYLIPQKSLLLLQGPGAVLYEKFGHSAIRIIDPNLNIDLIYNYGIFDFNTPNFYTNFAKGKMYYLLAKYDFKYFYSQLQNVMSVGLNNNF